MQEINVEVHEQVMFKNSLFFSKINLNNKKEFINEINKIKEKNNGKKISNVGGWQSKNFYSKKEVENFPNILKIISICENISDYLYKLWEIQKSPEISNFWINVNKTNNFNISHSHPGSIFSCVYYVSCNKNSGSIVFERPDQLSDYIINKKNNEYTYESYSVTPEDGNILFFPSYIKHYVEPNLSNDERISIAINFS